MTNEAAKQSARTFTARQTAKAMKVLSERYPREVTLAWSRKQYADKVREIAAELYVK